MANGFQSIETFGQVEQSKMTFLVKMNNGIIVKWDILCYLTGEDGYKLS